jgi:hypothetical protein
LSLQAFYVAATAVALLQYARLRDKRLLPLVLLLLFLSVAHIRGEWFAARPWHYLAGVAGLVLVLVIPRKST